MADTQKCPECGNPLPGETTTGLCVGCALKLGLQKPDTAAESPAPPATIRLDLVPSERPGDVLGRYKLLEKIGEGGFGAVYVAEQREPVKRRVALKIIKLGMDTREVVARFEAERQALAMMDHPNIAKVLDAGALENGRPYFVMELVRGIKITEYCDQNKLPTEERLDLFVKICHAVQHAHQKGIIHRDIKPSNILVTLHDGVPVPKVIDFGIAKATQGELTDKTVYTQFQQFIGTPAYMSPEQAEMSGLDVDTRSDIYSLGVLLYELLTGRTPFEQKDLIGAGIDEMRRIIREQEPQRPSTRLSTMAQGELTSTAARRQSDAPKLVHSVRGDLDWIVMKCIEKDRTHRYETANGLAMDLKRHLENEPVIARPPSVAYRFQKAWRRNKTAFTAGAAVLTALIIGLGASILMFSRERHAYAQAVVAEGRAIASEHQQSALRVEESKAKAAAQQSLYASLLGQARAIRLARHPGYRQEVFPLIEEAKALDVPEKNLDDLRRETVACLGDFVGLTPAIFTNFPTTLSAAILDPSGKLALFCLNDGTQSLREVSSDKEIARPQGLANGVWGFNSRGNELFNFGGESNAWRARAWSLNATAHWEERTDFPLPGSPRLMLSSDEDMFTLIYAHNYAQSGNSITLSLFNLSRQSFVEGHDLTVGWPRHGQGYLTATPDARLVAVETVDRDKPNSSAMLAFYDWSSDKPLHQISLPKLGHICLSPDGSSFDWMSEVGGALYHLPNMEQVGQFKGYFTRSGEFVGDYLALSLIQQARIQLWSLTTHEDVALFQEPEVATVQWTYAFCDSLMAVGVTHASVYRLRTPEKVAFPAHGAAVTGVAFSPDGARLASVDKNRILRVSDAARGQTLWEATNLPGPGQCVDFSPNGKWLVTGDYSTCLVEIWNAQTGQHLLELGTNTPGETTSTQFSPDGLYLATCNYGGSTNGICVYKRDEENTDADAPRFRLFKSLASEGVSLVFAPNSHSLAFAKGFDDGNLYVWNFDQSEAPDPLNSKFDISVQSIAFTPDSRRLLAQDWTQILTADPVTGKTITTFPLPGHRLGSSGQLLSLSPDGSCLAVSSATHLGVDLLDHVTGRMIYPLPEEYGTVYWLAWSPDSHRLAIARDDGSVAIWNLPVINETLAQLGLSP